MRQYEKKYKLVGLREEVEGKIDAEIKTSQRNNNVENTAKNVKDKNRN